ncbi:hypothetical protein Hjap01_03317 [Haloarcula japonica]
MGTCMSGQFRADRIAADCLGGRGERDGVRALDRDP